MPPAKDLVDVVLDRLRHFAELVYPPNDLGPSADPGQFPVGVRTLELVDPSRLNVQGDGPRPVTIEVTKLGEVNDPEMMGHRIGYTARTQIRRHDFGLAFDFIRDGKMVIGEEIQITIEGELVEQKDPAADSG